MDQTSRVTMAAMVTTVVLPMVSVDVSKRTEVTNNVRAASMRPKRRDRERRRCIIISFFFPVIFFLNWSIVEQSDGEDSNSNIHRVVRDFFFFFGFWMIDITHTHTHIYMCVYVMVVWRRLVIGEEDGCRMWRKEKNT